MLMYINFICQCPAYKEGMRKWSLAIDQHIFDGIDEDMAIVSLLLCQCILLDIYNIPVKEKATDIAQFTT